MSLNFEDWKKDFLTDAEQMGLLKIHPEGKQLGDNEWCVGSYYVYYGHMCTDYGAFR